MRWPLVAHEDGLGPFVDELLAKLRQRTDSMLVVSGLPGVGKSAAALACWDAARTAYDDSLYIKAGPELGLTRLLDEFYRELQIERPSNPSLDLLTSAAREFFTDHSVLLLLDNADETPASTVEFLGALPQGSLAMLTVRSSASLRAVNSDISELSHPGLSLDEMEELLSILVERDPLLASKFEAASRNDVQSVLVLLQGWPQALLLVVAGLTASTRHFKDYVDSLGADIYQELLGEVWDGTLSAGQRQLLESTVYFPSTFTVWGLAATTFVDVAQVETDLMALLRPRLVTEVKPRQFGYAHPLIGEFVSTRSPREPGAAETAASYLISWAERFGGQPDPDWENFLELDLEYENLRRLADDAVKRSDARRATTLYRSLFSYTVERGYWIYAEEHCEAALELKMADSLRVYWLVWASWIKFYLRADYVASAQLAEDAVALRARSQDQNFEAHRRAIVAYGRLGDHGQAADHYASADRLLRRMRNAELARADLQNSWGDALLQEARRGERPEVLAQCDSAYSDAAETMRGAQEPNRRELAVALLGLASVRLLRGQPEASLQLCADAVAIAEEIGWLRGRGEAARATAEVFDRLGQTEEAADARRLAEFVSSQLRKLPGEVSLDASAQ